MKSLFLIIGAPGSGKTTDASMIARMNQSIEHYSTGDLLRAEVASGSALGRQLYLGRKFSPARRRRKRHNRRD